MTTKHTLLHYSRARPKNRTQQNCAAVHFAFVPSWEGTPHNLEEIGFSSGRKQCTLRLCLHGRELQSDWFRSLWPHSHDEPTAMDCKRTTSGENSFARNWTFWAAIHESDGRFARPTSFLTFPVQFDPSDVVTILKASAESPPGSGTRANRSLPIVDQ